MSGAAARLSTAAAGCSRMRILLPVALMDPWTRAPAMFNAGALLSSRKTIAAW